MEQQKNYKDFLDRQQQEQAQRDLINKMTKDEKKLNFGDLQAYKGSDPKLFALVPGFINSKYQHPLGGTEAGRSPGKGNNKATLYADTLTQLDVNNHAGNYQPDNTYQQGYQQGNNYQQGSPSKAQNNQAIRYDAPHVSSPSRLAQNNVGSHSSSPTRDRRYDTQQQFQVSSPQYSQGNNFNGINQGYGEPYKTMTEMPSGKNHNPITNPLPVNIQNPYIMKEVIHMTNKRPYFANMATNNLLG